jgi:predicted O-methyltransferase YrrM
MNLNQTLTQIAKDFGLNANELIAYADEDQSIGGYHPDPRFQKFAAGAVWEVEGQILYALIRAVQPDNMLELGSFSGCSSQHMKSAMFANGGDPSKYYTCVSVDGAHGAVVMDAAMFLRETDEAYGLIFEDTTHSRENLFAVWQAGVPKLQPGGFMVSHDALHFREGVHVRAGIEDAGIEAKYYLTEPSDCGLAIWRKPLEEKKSIIEIAKAVSPFIVTGDDTPAPTQKPSRKRTSRKRKKAPEKVTA